MNIRGFTNPNVEIVLKVGGSLLAAPPSCKQFLDELTSLALEGRRIVIVPGGGPTDNTLETLDKALSLELRTAHRACALAQDQTGLVLCDGALSHGLVPCSTFQELRSTLDAGYVAVILPSPFIFLLDPIEQTWEVTSDAVGAWFAWLLDAKRFAVITNVDGVFADGEVARPEKLIKCISAEQLVDLGHTAIDLCAASFLASRRLDCTVLNGFVPGRLRGWVEGASVIGTLVEGDSRAR